MPKTCSEPRRLSLHGPTMGTRWSVLCDTHQDLDVPALQRALADVVRQIDAQMSPWLPHSDLNRLNRAEIGLWVSLPSDILEVLVCGLKISRQSEGAFDPGAGQLVDAWGFGPARDIPDAAAIRAARHARAPTHEALEVDVAAGRVRKHAPLQLDLCGIAKGYAVDRMTALLEQWRVTHALTALDGELRALNSQANGQPWAVAVEAPQAGRRSVHGVLELQNLSVATSGDYRRYVQVGDARCSHTMDTRHAAPVRNEVASVTVLAGTCMEADAWATALLVTGPSLGQGLAHRMGLEAQWILRRENHLVSLGLTPACA